MASRGLLFVVVSGLLIAVASLVAGPGLRSLQHGMWNFPDRDRTSIPLIDSRFLSTVPPGKSGYPF